MGYDAIMKDLAELRHTGEQVDMIIPLNQSSLSDLDVCHL
jgi:hypothetical protein